MTDDVRFDDIYLRLNELTQDGEQCDFVRLPEKQANAKLISQY